MQRIVHHWPMKPIATRQARASEFLRPGSPLPPLPRLLLVLLCLLLLAGCKVELYSDLPEDEANTLLSALLDGGIDASKKTAAKKGEWTLMVEEKQLPDAMNLLQQHGLPRPKYKELDQIFGDEGMITSPLVERARYIYALSQEVARTLSDLDGVLIARVHFVLPKLDEITETVTPSSAAVFLKYDAGADIPARVHDIKKFVQYTIPDLALEKIEVFLFPTDIRKNLHKTVQPSYSNVLGLQVRPADAMYAWFILATAMVLLLLAAALGAMLLRRHRTGEQDAGE